MRHVRIITTKTTTKNSILGIIVHVYTPTVQVYWWCTEVYLFQPKCVRCESPLRLFYDLCRTGLNYMQNLVTQEDPFLENSNSIRKREERQR